MLPLLCHCLHHFLTPAWPPPTASPHCPDSISTWTIHSHLIQTYPKLCLASQSQASLSLNLISGLMAPEPPKSPNQTQLQVIFSTPTNYHPLGHSPRPASSSNGSPTPALPAQISDSRPGSQWLQQTNCQSACPAIQSDQVGHFPPKSSESSPLTGVQIP